MGGFSIRCSQNIAYAVIGIGITIVEGRITHTGDIPMFGKQLPLVVIGIGRNITNVVCDCQNISRIIIGIGVFSRCKGRSGRCFGILHGLNLGGCLTAGDIPVCIVPGKDAAAHGGQPPQTVITHGELGQCRTISGDFEGIQTAVRGIVGEILCVAIAAYLPALLGHLIAGIICLVGTDYDIAPIQLLAVNQAANGVVGIHIGDIRPVAGLP